MQYFCKLFIIDQRQPNENWKKKKKKACFCQPYMFCKFYIIQFVVSYILVVSLKFRACYIMGQ